MRLHLTILRPEGKAHFFSHAFDEVLETLAYGLRALGHPVSYKMNHFARDAQNIIFGGHFCNPETPPPAGSVFYNLEQIGANDQHMISPAFINERYPIWDYSPANMPYWHERKVNAELVPVGYTPQLTRIRPVLHPDIDVLFYGSINARRGKIISELQRDGSLHNVQFVNGFGGARDAIIARAKVVVNIHFYEKPQLFEGVRVSYLLANRKCAVCEKSDDFPTRLEGAVKVVPYDQLAETCRELVHDTNQRLEYQQRGFDLFSKFRESDILRGPVSRLKPAESFAQGGTRMFTG